MSETLETAIEAAPAIIWPDGEGGATFHVLTDEAITDAIAKHVEANGWTEDEREGLYVAVYETLSRVAQEECWRNVR